MPGYLSGCPRPSENAGQTYQPENEPFFALMHTNETQSNALSAKNVNMKPCQ